MIENTIGADIRARREALGLSQREAAELAVAVTYSALSRIERAERIPTIRTLEGLSIALQCRFLIRNGNTFLLV